MKALLALGLYLWSCSALAQISPNSDCTLTPPVLTASAPNIFDDRQEQDLGDALAEYVESNMRVAVPAPEDELTRIGERLLATLPLTKIHYKFRIYDSGEINGFAIAGGRIYISRKMIAAVQNEDELAGVLAHEIGHLATHQTAVAITRILRIRLGVTQVDDRSDIFAKVHLMFSSPAKPKENEDTEERDQLVADHVALYAMVRAGYAPDSFASFLDESMVNKGKTGGWLSDLVGMTHESAKRYRSAVRLIAALPDSCKSRKPGISGTFQAWLHATVDERVKTAIEGISGEMSLVLDPPLRPSLWRIRFSPDGRLLLAQDETGITIINKDAAKVLFRIDAPNARAAQFAPDSASVAFHDDKLRVEQWSVLTGKRTSVKEMVVFDGCNQTVLSPDAKTMVCINMSLSSEAPRISLRLVEVESGKVFFEKPSFFESTAFTPYLTELLLELRGMTGAMLANVLISPDGRYLLATIENNALAYDLERRQPVALGGKLKGLVQTRMSFLGQDQLLVVGAPKGHDLYEARILTFPEGKMVKETEIGDQQIQAVSKGRLVIAQPLKDYAVGILDPMQGKFVKVAKQPAMDAWDQFAVNEDAAGGVMVGQMGVPGTKRIPLPLGLLPVPRAETFSADGRYLAVSVRTRGEIWDLETGKKVSLVRPFRSAWMDGEDHLYAQFPKFMESDPVELRITMAPPDAKGLAKYDGEDWQYHDLQYRFKPMGKDKATNHHATLEMKKMETQTVVWTREYPHETPACWPAEDSRLVLAWDLSNATAKSEIKTFPGLQRQMESLKSPKKGILLETVNPETGAPLEQVVLPEAAMSSGLNDARRAIVSGEYVLVHGEHDTTAIHRLDSGAKVGEFFGSPVATDAVTSLIAAVNREEEILLIDERTGKELKRFTFGSPVRAARIVSGKDKVLLVLTADQTVHRMSLP